MSLPVDFPSEERLMPLEHLGEAGEQLVVLMAPWLPPDLYREAALKRLLRTVAYHGHFRGLAYKVQDHTLWGHLLIALGLPDFAYSEIAYLETGLQRLAEERGWAYLAQAPTVQGSQANLLLYPVARLAPYPVYALVGGQVHQVLLAALREWAWPAQQPKPIANALSTLGRMAPHFRDEILADLARALETHDETALVNVVWAVSQRVSRQRGPQDEPLSPATRRRYYYEFITWALGMRRIHPPAGQTSVGGLGSAARSVLSEAREVRPPEGVPRPGRRPPSPPRPLDDDDNPVEADAPDGYRAATYARAVARTRREAAPEDDLAAALLPAPASESEGGLPPWLLPESRQALHRAPYLWAWQALPPDGWAAVVRHTLPRRDPAVLVLLTAALTGRNLDELARVTRYDPRRLPGPGEPPAYDPVSHTLVLYPAVWGHLPRQPQPADLYLPVARRWHLPLPAFLASRWRVQAGRAASRAPLFPPSTAAQARQMLAGLGARWRRRHPADAPFTPGRLRRAWLHLMQALGGLDPLLSGWLSGLWPEGHYPPLFYTTLSLPWLACHFEQALGRVGRFWGLPLNAPQPLPRPHLLMGSVYHPRLGVLRQAVRVMAQAVQQAASPTARHNTLTLQTLYGLALFLGLRMGEASTLRVGQFDLAATWQGESLPWLTLPNAKGNRFTTAARIVPLPPPLLPALRELLATVPNPSLDAPALGFYTTRRWVPATPEAIRARLQALGVPFPRWHAGRHLLRSFLLRYGMSHEGINLILGHQAAGEEAWSPFRTVDIGAYFRTYRRLTQTLARLLRWPVPESLPESEA